MSVVRRHLVQDFNGPIDELWTRAHIMRTRERDGESQNNRDTNDTMKSKYQLDKDFFFWEIDYFFIVISLLSVLILKFSLL